MEKLFSIIPIASIPFACGLVVIIVGYIKLWRLRKTKIPEIVGIFSIWLIGIIALLLGILGHIYTSMKTFDFVAQAGDISASIMADGMKESYNSTYTGLVVLIISLITWGILKGVKQRKIILKTLIKEND